MQKGPMYHVNDINGYLARQSGREYLYTRSEQWALSYCFTNIENSQHY